MTTAETLAKGYPRKKVTIFFKSVETKTGCSGKKLGRAKKFRFFSKTVGKKRGIGERNWVDEKKSKIFQKW